MLREAVVFEDVEKRGLAGVVEAEEEDLRVLVVEDEPAQDIKKPVVEKHCETKSVAVVSRRRKI